MTWKLTLLLTWILAVHSHSTVRAQDELSLGKWIRFDQCPVLVEHTVPVPAPESGVLDALSVELNKTVTRETPVAKLDDQLATTDLNVARLQYSLAKKLADDDSDIEFYRVALAQVELELENHELLGRNVNASEIRRLKLAVGKAELALTRAQEAKARAILDAQVKFANIDLATKRLTRRTIQAPLSGVVSKVFCKPGQWVEAGEPIVEIKNLEELTVDRLIPAQDVRLSSIIGSRIRVELPKRPADQSQTPDAGPAYLEGIVSSYDHEITAQGLIRIHTRVQNRRKNGHWILLPGMNVNLLLPAQHLVPTVSRSAYRTGSAAK